MTQQSRALIKKYYVAGDPLIDFLENGKKSSFNRFASEAGVSGRTVARLRKKERINRNTANKILEAAVRAGFTGSFEDAFVENTATA
jgi:hypothetical protein